MTAQARFSTLQEWLAWQEHLHPAAIDLGLQRVERVASRLACRRPAPTVISVAGTNGKGSCVAMLEAILLCAGYRVGAYTSPHLLRYNERLRLDGEDVGDASWCAAFARVDAARAEQTLTYFEFGTLAALDIMTRHDLDVALLEVGLGGRLDAVNCVDADAALISSIGIDHTDWLGPDRDSIAREKAGILRPGCPAVCGDPQPPDGLLAAAAQAGAEVAVYGRDYAATAAGSAWSWRGRQRRMEGLPLPALAGGHQLINAAAVLSLLEALQVRLPVSDAAVAAGLRAVRLPGRVQYLGGPVDQVLDVSHNAQAAQALADSLRRLPPVQGRAYAVLGMMQDKDLPGFVTPLLPYVDVWCATGLDTPRASPPDTLAAGIRELDSRAAIVVHAGVGAAFEALRRVVKPGDRVLVCGSFHTVAAWTQLPAIFE